MIKFIVDIYHVWWNEMKVIVRDPAVLLLFLIVPFMYPLLYAYMYNNEVVHEIKTVVVDESNSSLSREFIRKVDGSGEVKIIARALNMNEAKEAMSRKDAYGIIYIPSTFSKDINNQKQTTVIVYSDMSSMLFYKSLVLTCTEVSLDMGADIRLNHSKHGTQEQDASTLQSVAYESVPFFNITNGFASFLVPGILILIIQQTLVLGIGTIMGTHKDKKRFSIASNSMKGRDVSALSLTLGKGFCYSTIYLITSAFIIRVVPYLFKLPQIGDPFTILAFIFPYILAATFFAMTISYFVSQREFVMLLFVFTSILFIFISGISWPWISVPTPLKGIAYLIPSTPGIHGFVKINTMGATLMEVRFEYIALWIQSVVYCLLSTAMYFWWIDNYDPKYKGKHPALINKKEK